MGADLYIKAVFEASRTEWATKFDVEAKLRDSLPDGSAEYTQAQHKVEHCYEQMYSRGYFRDPYNGWDLLWKFKLSWWEDVILMLDKHGRLSVTATRRPLKLIEEREGIFEGNMRELSVEDQDYFRDAQTRLKKFLRQAIALGEPIDCSLWPQQGRTFPAFSFLFPRPGWGRLPPPPLLRSGHKVGRGKLARHSTHIGATTSADQA